MNTRNTLMLGLSLFFRGGASSTFAFFVDFLANPMFLNWYKKIETISNQIKQNN